MTQNPPESYLHPFFLAGEAGGLFALFFRPRKSESKRAVLYCPPFAEEANKARRMAALQARQLSEMGIGVLFVDYFGTGDSHGEFSDARWSRWKDDMKRAVEWLTQQGYTLLTLWGLRLGGLMAMELAAELKVQVERIILWNPVVNGEVMLTQFLRLRLAADMMAEGEKTTTRDLRLMLASGESLEVAGYEVVPALAAEMDRLRMVALATVSMPPVHWVEVVPSAERPMGMASRKVIDAWKQAGVNVDAEVVVGDMFWNTPEISVVPELLTLTSQRMSL